MSAADPARPPPEESAAALLDQILRGERATLLPPGALVVSLFVPCLCIAAAPLGVLLAASVGPSDASEGVAKVLWPMGFALAVVAVAFVGQVLVITGRAAARAVLSAYVRGLFIMTLVLGGAAVLGWLPSSPILAGVAAAALLACRALLGSWSYAAATAFFSLKRKYRQDARAAAAKALRERR